MRTGCLPTVPILVPPLGVSTSGGGVSIWRGGRYTYPLDNCPSGRIPAPSLGYLPPEGTSMDRMTDRTCENITFPQLLLQVLTRTLDGVPS